jgi:hypothetical protein
MSLVRIQKTARQTLTHVFSVDEVATDLTGDCTVTLKRLDGMTVDSATAGHPGLGTYTYALPAQANLDSLTLDWSGLLAGATVTVRDYVEIVGGFIFGLAEGRAAHSGLASTTTYPPALLAAKRIAVEQECERICRQAWVPRFERELLSGTGTSRLPLARMVLRAVRAVSVAGVAWSAPDVAAVAVSEHGILTRPGGAIWPAGASNIVVEYEHGHDFPPEDVKDAAILRLRSKAGQNTSSVPDRATSFTITDGGVYRLSTPNREKTGIPEVDGPYEGNQRQRRAVFA